MEDQPLGHSRALRHLRTDPRYAVLSVVRDRTSAITIARALRPAIVVVGSEALATEIRAALSRTHPGIAVVVRVADQQFAA